MFIIPPNGFKMAAAAAKSRQSCPTLCDPLDGSPSGSAVPGILQARMLEWVAAQLQISFMSMSQGGQKWRNMGKKRRKKGKYELVNIFTELHSLLLSPRGLFPLA